MAAVVRRLPFGLSRIVAPSLLGFAVINGFTFSVDLGLLTLAHRLLHWPYPAAVTVSYLTAFALSFVLNRVFNFESHGALGQQTARYVVAVGVNYLVFVLGVGTGLTAAGVGYALARVLSGLLEGVYMYCVMRWVVFQDAAAARAGAATPDSAAARAGAATPDPAAARTAATARDSSGARATSAADRRSTTSADS
ncbi:GtrA family protein [Catenulispora pinisilvae]|uniref:GtrA family protein n=1 Tax=Catenulispora pinisilvae TaxID=2705253 RepID=UPI001890B9A0|nr:GtrA family protein [Catenulispora pinisilvae]